eukprot:GHRQ01025400.1.p1 GENE.GHRQ01025400.1~~GHRQ01025400.1.p1  ORF type:complete len:102 (-),score=11.47 GHRQ01025400.1:105-410(-)
MSYSSVTLPYVTPPSLHTGCSFVGSTTSLPEGLRPATPSAMWNSTTSASTTALEGLPSLQSPGNNRAAASTVARNNACVWGILRLPCYLYLCRAYLQLAYQ